jgi:hypothetical protein
MPWNSGLKEVDKSPHASAQFRPIFAAHPCSHRQSMNFRSMSPLPGDFVSCWGGIEGDK